MDSNMLLYIALLIYTIVMIGGLVFKEKLMFVVGGLVWVIPLFEINNFIIQFISVVMILLHGIFGLGLNDKGDEFQ